MRLYTTMLVVSICGGLMIDSHSALGPRSVRAVLESSAANEPVTFLDRRPASTATGSLAGTSDAPLRLSSTPISFDAHGLIVQADGDGGDTAQRTGMLYFVYDDVTAFDRALRLLEVRPGIYVRHPFQPGFRRDPLEFSRDQQRALVIAMGAYGMTDRLLRLATEHLQRLGKYQNRDWIGPSHIGEYIRALRLQTGYPILIATDLALLFNSIRIVLLRRDPNDSDDNNHILSLAQSRYVMPTPASWIARKLYKSFRPTNSGNYHLRESHTVQGALAWYHRAENGGNPLIAELYRDVVKDL